MAESCWCKSFCHQTALKSLTRSEKPTKFFQNPNLISIWYVSIKKLCVISQQKRSFSFKMFLTLRSLHIAMFLRGWLVGWLCWGLMSQSTIFQSYRDGAIASWVINQYFRGVKCLAQGHNTAAVGLEPRTSRSGVRHSTTEPQRSPVFKGRQILAQYKSQYW